MTKEFEKEVEEIEELFQLANLRLKDAVETMHRCRERVAEFRTREEFDHLPKEFIDQLFGGFNEIKN